MPSAASIEAVMSTRHESDSDEPRRLRFSGIRGPSFRKERRDFFALARGKFCKDDRHSFYLAFKRMDEGGTSQGAPPLPAAQGGAGGGANAAHTAAVTKRTIRQGSAYRWLYELQDDEDSQMCLWQKTS